MDSSTGLSFNLNLHPSSENRVSENDLNHQENLDAAEQTKNQEGGNNLMEVISRIDRESKKMAEMVATMFDKCSAMHNQLMDLMMINSNHHADNNDQGNLQRKRKAQHLDDHNEDDNNNCHLSELSCVSDGNCCNRIRMISCKPKITRALIRIDSSDTSLVVKDGYQWRKYGQKVTRDNPSPRAYFKCSFAPICPVKKKVQKSVEDPTVLVATYEGEHNHKKPSSVGTLITPSPIISSSLINLSPSSCISSPSPSLDHLVHQNHSDVDNHKQRGSDNEEDNDDQPRGALQHWLVEQMASSIAKDPSFASTVAAAISDKVIEQTFC